MSTAGSGKDGLSSIARSRPFIGRQAELILAEDSLEMALTGKGSSMIISGPAGIGKTMLSKEIARYATAEGFQVFSGSCIRYEGHHSTAFTGLIDDVNKSGFSDPGGEQGISLEARRLNILHHVKRMALRKPLLILIDDLQWADQGELNIFQFLARNISSDRVLLIAMVRSEELAFIADERMEALTEIIRILRNKNLVQDVRLAPFDDQDVKEMVSKHLGGEVDGKLIVHLIEASKGNPLFLSELITYMDSARAIVRGTDGWTFDSTKPIQIPKAISDVVMGRMSSLSGPEREMIESFSVLGSSFPEELGAAVALKVGDIWDRTFYQLEQREGLIVKVGGSVNFSHEVVHRAIYSSLASDSRRRLHMEAAEAALRTRFATDDGLLSYHFTEGGDQERALRHSLAAARKAVYHEAVRDGMTYYQRVLRSLGGDDSRGTRLEAYENLGDLFHMTCRFETAQEMFRQAILGSHDNEQKARLMRKMSLSISYLEGQKNISKAIEMLDDASLLDGVSQDEKAEILSHRCSFINQLGRTDEAIECSKAVSSIFHTLGETDKELWQIVNTAFYLIRKGLHLEARSELDRAGLLIGPEIKRYILVQYHTTSCELDFILGNYQKALESIDKLSALNPDLGLYSDASYNHWLKSTILDINGNVNEALKEALLSLELANIDEMRRAVVRSKVLISQLYLESKRTAESEMMLSEVTEIFDGGIETTFIVGPCLYWITLAGIHRSKGLHDLAEEEAAKGLSIINVNNVQESFVPVALLWDARSRIKEGDSARGSEELIKAKEVLLAQGNTTFIQIIEERFFR